VKLANNKYPITLSPYHPITSFSRSFILFANHFFAHPKLPSAFYIHRQGLPFLDPLIQKYEQSASKIHPHAQNATLVKFDLQQPKISYLFYPDFDLKPHPSIEKSIIINVKTKTLQNIRVYSDYDNPAILHRKETFVTPEYSFL
jgi:DNA phosphorothioation-associated putative methyltransferase